MKHTTNLLRKPLAFLLTMALLFGSMGLTGFAEDVYATDAGLQVSVRIENENLTLLHLQDTPLNVERFDISPFITGDVGTFTEPDKILSAHALIEAIYYDNYKSDPTVLKLSSPGGLTLDTINKIKEDLNIQIGSFGLSITSIYGNSRLVMSAIDNVGRGGIGSDELSEGDNLVFYPYKDSSNQNLNYAYFSESAVPAIVGSPTTLTLKNIVTDYTNYSSSVKAATDASIYINDVATAYKTDAVNGTVSLSFDAPGEYIVSATKGNPNTITRPYCKITVAEGIGLNNFSVTSLSQGKNSTSNILPSMDSQHSYEMYVENAATTFSALLVPSEEGATMSAIYTKAPNGIQPAIEVTSGTSIDFDLEVGTNHLKVDISKDNELKTYHLNIVRLPKLVGLQVNLVGSDSPSINLSSSDTTKFNIADSNVTGVSATAISANGNQTISVRCTKSGATPSSQIPLVSGTPTMLANSVGVGNNVFEFAVTENNATKTYTFILSQIGSESTDSTVNTIINSISSGTINYDSDWIIAMYAAGKSSLISEAQKSNYLSTVLQQARQDASKTDTGKLSKMIIALTAMGIDPRQVPDANGVPIDLVSKLSNSKSISDLGLFGIYTAPYILLAYDSGNYEVSSSASLSRSNVISYILSEQSASAWGGDVDATGMVLPSLAPYQTTSGALTNEAIVNSVRSAVQSALTWLSTQQASDGSFSSWGSRNSNSTSTVITALSALGVNADTDTRFIKGNISALDDLLSYRTTDNRFGYLDSNYNAFSTMQGYIALISHHSLQSMNENGGNIYKFKPLVSLYDKWPNSRILTDIIVTSSPATHTKGTKLTASALVVKAKYKSEITQELVPLTGSDYTISDYNYNETGAKTVLVSYQGKTASFVVTVVDSQSNVNETKSISLTVKGAKGKEILRVPNFVIVEKKTTVMDALKSALGQSGYTVEINAAGNYVERIDGLGEFDLGKNSGWMYSVNGTTPPTTAASDYKLSNGDIVLWYFTEDYTKNSGSSMLPSTEKQAETTVEAKVDSKGVATATVVKADLENAVKKNSSLTLQSKVATITLDPSTVSQFVKNNTGDLKVTATPVDPTKQSDALKSLLGARPILDFSVTIGSKEVTTFAGKVTISIPYTPAASEDVNGLLVYYINKDGQPEPLKNSRYSATNKAITFSTNHFSQYAVGYHKIAFEDITTHWANASINYLASRDVIKGKSEGQFKPNDNITRAEFVTILANKAGVDLSKYNTNTFVDVIGGASIPSNSADNKDNKNDSSAVKSASWYANAVSWASTDDIVTGIKNSDGTFSFNPNAPISRQDMAVMLDRFEQKVEKTTLPSINKGLAFADDAQASDYAKASISTMQKAGIINGVTNADNSISFEPKKNATRAETAKMIATLMQGTI